MPKGGRDRNPWAGFLYANSFMGKLWVNVGKVVVVGFPFTELWGRASHCCAQFMLWTWNSPCQMWSN